MKRMLNELDTQRHNCGRRRYFIIEYQGEAMIIFWAQYYNYTHFVNRIIGSRSLSISEATLAEAETMEVICDIPYLHLNDAEVWMRKEKYRIPLGRQ